MSRREQLETIRQSILGEIYRLCLEMGLDPETFDVNSAILEDDRPELGATLGAHCKKLQTIERKLEEISWQ